MAAQARALAESNNPQALLACARGRSSATGRGHPRGARGCIAGPAGPLPHGALRCAVPARRPVSRREDDLGRHDRRTRRARSTPRAADVVDEWKVVDDGLVVGTLNDREVWPQTARRDRAPHAGLGRLGAHAGATMASSRRSSASSCSVARRCATRARGRNQLGRPGRRRRDRRDPAHVRRLRAGLARR